MPDSVPLLHGTTRRRALAILVRGPNHRYVEPGGCVHDPAGGFSTYPADHPRRPGDPDAARYARGKAALFPDDGGPCILQVEVPGWVADLVRLDPLGRIGYQDSGEIRFEPGMGLEELLREWPRLSKRVIPV